MKEGLIDLPSEATDKVIDLELGIELAGNETFAWNLLNMLKIFLFEDIPRLQIAYEKQDWNTIQVIAYHIYENARFCGTPRLTAASSDLHRYLTSEETELRETLYQQLLKEAKAVKEVI